jgi:hypothetical protein
MRRESGEGGKAGQEVEGASETRQRRRGRDDIKRKQQGERENASQATASTRRRRAHADAGMMCRLLGGKTKK